MDNVVSESIIRVVLQQKHLEFNLQIDTLPCEITEDDILAALMQLLPWVCISCVYKCDYV